MFQQEIIHESNVKIVKTMIKLLFFAITPLFILSMLRILQQGWIPVMYLHLFLFSCAAIFYFRSAHISINLQKKFMILCFVLIGAGTMVNTQSIIYGSSFFLISYLFTILFYSTKEVITLALFILLSQFIFVNFTRERILIQDYLFLTALPVLGIFAVYIINHMRSTLLQAIEQLNLAKLEAQKATLIKSQLLAVMSHEIRTPLNGIILGSDLINQSSLKENERENIEIIRNCSETLQGIINDILDFSKIDAGKVVLERKPVDLRKVLSKTLELFKYKNDVIETEIFIKDDFPAYVITDSVKIRQIVLNLLSNAFKFTKEGKIALSLDFKKKSEDSAQVIFSVSDTGIGIAEKNKHLLFQDFQQIDSSITREFGGTGLGLWITKKLVTLLSGTIDVQSEVGKGTTFTCTFEMKIDLEQPVQIESENGDQKTLNVSNKEKLNALVVEDNAINQFLLQETLKLWGIGSVHIAANGIEAVEKCENNRYDIIFMDIQMPGMDGIEATKRIRASTSCNNNTRIIATTANADETNTQKCIDAGVNDFISKPISRKLLKDIIEASFKD